MPITNQRLETILEEQIKQLYRYSILRLSALVIVAVCIASLAWEKLPQDTVVAWLSVGLVVLLARAILEAGYKTVYSKYTAKHWAILMAIATTVTGCFFGSSAFLIRSVDSINTQIGIAMFALGYTLVATAALYPFLPSYYGLLLSAFLPIAVVFLISSTKIGVVIGLACIAYIFMASMFARANHAMQLKTLNLQLDVEEQKKAAIEANLSKSRFLAAASHDLRQPLHALSLFVGILENRITGAANQKTINSIKNTLGVLENMFNALLDITKLDAKVIEPKYKHIKVHSIINHLQEEFRQLAYKKGLSWSSGDCAWVVYTDPVLLETILRNLISNAIRFTDQGSISVSCEETNDSICISVKDTGIGIPGEHKEEIFNEFYQIPNGCSDQSKGFGLGLSIVKRLCDLLEIPISLDSELGKGTTFGINLKKGDEKEIESAAYEDNLLVHTRFRNALVVVIENEPEIERSMVALLEQWECHVISGNSVDAVLPKIANANKQPDIIITDYWLEDGQTGLNALQAIERQTNRNIPALIITGDASVAKMDAVKNAGYTVLLKPVQPARLRVFIRNTLAKS